jgi:hypothetical protein
MELKNIDANYSISRTKMGEGVKEKHAELRELVGQCLKCM